ncbi:Flagellar motor rotation protein MotB [hydrothermal vent metagenome]|uniref:Flagellar motor rotation protein MotB n=1 Tax=hydrothermal vent metagenome TaxID=652676 RepID=A0A3B0WAR7_9ZZZZ
MSDCECVEVKCEEGIPAWVMTFADLMSLLLAFFVLLFSFSEMDKNVYKELAGSLKDAFGVQREIKVRETPRGINIIAREFSPGKPKPTVHNEVRQMTTDESKMFAVFTDASKEGQENQSKKSDEVEDKAFNAMREETETTGNAELSEEDLAMINRIKSDSEALREALNEEIDQGLIDMEVTQQRIILMVREKGSFLSGSADLIEPFKVVIDKISEVFNDFDGVIIVAGHTDNFPIKTYRFRSNWELSSSRAVSVIHELLKDKVLKEKKFEIAAYADTQPVDSNASAIGRAKNRRVEIMMDYSKNTHDETTDAGVEKTVHKEVHKEDLVGAVIP